MTMLTKNDILAFQRCDTLAIHYGSRHPNGLVRLIKRKAHNAKPFEQDQEYQLENARVAMENSEGKRAMDEGKAECFAHVPVYHEQRCPASSILKTLRAGDEITFSFYPDCHTNDSVARAGLHADALYLHVVRKGKRQTWKLDSLICPENTARMCRGVSHNHHYYKAVEA